MFGMGIGELLLIFVIALLVFGPDKLPQVARTTGKFMRDLKRTTNDIKYSIEREINLSELQQTLDLPAEVKRSMQDLVLPPDEVERRRKEKIRRLKAQAKSESAAGPAANPYPETSAPEAIGDAGEAESKAKPESETKQEETSHDG